MFMRNVDHSLVQLNAAAFFVQPKLRVWQPAESAGRCKGKSWKLMKTEALLVLNTGMQWKTMLNLRKNDMKKKKKKMMMMMMMMMMMKVHHDLS